MTNENASKEMDGLMNELGGGKLFDAEKHSKGLESGEKQTEIMLSDHDYRKAEILWGQSANLTHDKFGTVGHERFTDYRELVFKKLWETRNDWEKLL